MVLAGGTGASTRGFFLNSNQVMKLSSATAEIIDVLRHGHRGLARLFVMGRVSAPFNLLIPEPPRLQFYYNESLMFIPPSLPIRGKCSTLFKDLFSKVIVLSFMIEMLSSHSVKMNT